MQYVFDRDFDGELTAKTGRSQRFGAIYTREEYDEAVASARAEGYSDGRTAGRAEAVSVAVDSEAERQLHALEAVGPALTALFADADRHHAVLESQMLDYLITIFERVAPEVVATLARPQALREAEAALRMALGSAALRIHMAPDAVRESGDHLKRAARLAGFAGRADVLADPDLAIGDVRADWDHGVMRYSFNDICQRIFDALDAVKSRADQKAGRSKAGEQA